MAAGENFGEGQDGEENEEREGRQRRGEGK
jgi:hypothetical protein